MYNWRGIRRITICRIIFKSLIGFDDDLRKIEELKKANKNIIYTDDPSEIKEADFVIIAVLHL